MILRLKVPERIKIFVWLLKHDRLLKNHSKSRKGVGAAACNLCGHITETTLHVYHECPRALKISWIKLQLGCIMIFLIWSWRIGLTWILIEVLLILLVEVFIGWWGVMLSGIGATKRSTSEIFSDCLTPTCKSRYDWRSMVKPWKWIIWH